MQMELLLFVPYGVISKLQHTLTEQVVHQTCAMPEGVCARSQSTKLFCPSLVLTACRNYVALCSRHFTLLQHNDVSCRATLGMNPAQLANCTSNSRTAFWECVCSSRVSTPPIPLTSREYVITRAVYTTCALAGGDLPLFSWAVMRSINPWLIDGGVSLSRSQDCSEPQHNDQATFGNTS